MSLDVFFSLTGYFLVYGASMLAAILFAALEVRMVRWFWFSLPGFLTSFLGLGAYQIGMSGAAIVLPFFGLLWMLFDALMMKLDEESPVEEVRHDPVEDLTAADIMGGETALDAEYARILARNGQHLKLVASH